jgi:tetratricopeptide (TPR) repeat protein
VKAQANVAEHQRDLAVTHSNLAMVLAGLGRSEKEVQASLAEAITMQKKLVGEFPNVSQYKNDLARSCFNLGDSQLRSSQGPRAAGSYEEAAKLWKDLVSLHPTVQDFRINLAEAHSALAGVHGALRDFDKAAAAAQEAIALKEQLATKHDDVPTYQNDLARGHSALADVHRAAGQAAKAENAYQDALRILDKLAKDHPGVPQYEGDRARTLNNLGLLYVNDKQRDKGESTFEKARDIWQKLHQAQPEVMEWAIGLSRTCANLGNLARTGGDSKAALDCYTAAIEPLGKNGGGKKLTSPGQQVLRTAHWRRAEVLTQLNRHGEALRDWDKAVSLTSGAENHWFRLQRALSLARTGDHAQAAGEADALRQQNDGTGEAFYQLACIYALSLAALKNANDPQRADQYAARAMEMLAKARDLGFFQTRGNPERLSRDGDMEALRGRSDFQKLERELTSPAH